MTAPIYEVYARDRDYRRVGLIEDYGDLAAIRRFNDVGTWTLSASPGSNAAGFLTSAGGGTGIVVTRDDQVIFSGPVTAIKTSARRFECSGFDDLILLSDNVALPDPSLDPPSPYAVFNYRQGHDTFTAGASFLLDYYAKRNIGPTARTGRGLPFLTFAPDPGLGATITATPRFNNLLALLQELALQGGGLRFDILQSSTVDWTLQFRITQPVDRSASVVLSEERGTLGAFEKTWRAPAANYVIVLGQDQDVIRQILEGGDTASIQSYGRQVMAVADQRQTDDIGVFLQKRSEVLAQGAERRAITLTPLDTESVAWGTDYDLGDTINAVVDGETLTESVREVQISLSTDTNDPLIQATVATPGESTDESERAARQIRSLDSRVSHLEREDGAVVTGDRWEIGDLRPTGRQTVARGWLLCDGAEYDRTTYELLFAAIGTAFGSGNGTTTFNVPDLRGRFPMGASGAHAIGTSGGAEQFNNQHFHDGSTLTQAAHNHTGAAHTHPHSHADGTLAAAAQNLTGASITGATGALNGTTGLTSNKLVTAGAGTEDYIDHLHGHTVGTLDVAGTTDGGDVTGNTSSDSTGASFSANTGNATPAISGNTGSAGSSAQSVLNPFQAVRYEILAGV